MKILDTLQMLLCLTLPLCALLFVSTPAKAETAQTRDLTTGVLNIATDASETLSNDMIGAAFIIQTILLGGVIALKEVASRRHAKQIDSLIERLSQK